MRRKCAIFTFFFAWLLSTGSQWDALQVVAWTRMFTLYAQSFSLLEAARLTFEPDSACALCKTADEGRSEQSGAQGDSERLRKKPLAVFAAHTTCLTRLAENRTLSAADWALPESRRELPPLPPPRNRA